MKKNITTVGERFEIHNINWDQRSGMIIRGLSIEPEFLSRLLFEISKNGISVDMVIQNYVSSDSVTVSLLFGSHYFSKRKLSCIKREINNVYNNKWDVEIVENLIKVVIQGHGLRTCPEIATKIFRKFAKDGQNIEMLSIGENEVSLVFLKNPRLESLLNEITGNGFN